MLTLVHELSIHVLKFAEILIQNKPLSERVLELTEQTQGIHHRDMIDNGSKYNVIMNELLDNYKNKPDFTNNQPFSWGIQQVINLRLTEDHEPYVDAMNASTYNNLVLYYNSANGCNFIEADRDRIETFTGNNRKPFNLRRYTQPVNYDYRQ